MQLQHYNPTCLHKLLGLQLTQQDANALWPSSWVLVICVSSGA